MALTHEHQPTFFEKAEAFFRKYRNIILGALAVLVIGVGYLVYRNYQLRQLQDEAAEKMVSAQIWFTTGQDSLALRGDGIYAGFLEIIDEYSGTAAANLSNYYAGNIYLRQEDYQNAIKHIEAYKPKGDLVDANAKLSLGHAYAQSGDADKAAKAYKAATVAANNEIFTPMFLKIAGDYHVAIGSYEEAEKLYTRIRDEYPMSTEGRDIERFIVFAQQKQI